MLIQEEQLNESGTAGVKSCASLNTVSSMLKAVERQQSLTCLGYRWPVLDTSSQRMGTFASPT